MLFYFTSMTDLTFYALSHTQCYEICKKIRAAYHYDDNNCTLSVNVYKPFILCLENGKS